MTEMSGESDEIAVPMDHPPSPMGAVPIQDGHSPHSPPEHPHHMDPSMGYRPPHPAYGPPPGYPPYPAYGAPPHSPYGGPPPGYPRVPPGTYPSPHHSPSYGYGYPGGPRPPYHYYDGGYPSQQSRASTPYRGAPPRQSAPPAQPTPQPTRHPSPQKSSSSSPTGKSSPTRSPDVSARPPKIADHVEVERLRAAAAAEITHEEVKPIQSDYHFFVKDNVEKFRKLAEEEVRKSMKGDKLDPYLVNTNLNSRLMKAWEDLKNEQRDMYMVKEEDDRRRFMEEDEIASRHCATLTARGKSPRSSEKGNKEERQESETPPATSPDRESSPNDKSKAEIPDSDDEDEETQSEDDDDEEETVEVESAKKRVSPAKKDPKDSRESPTKRNRVTDDKATI